MEEDTIPLPEAAATSSEASEERRGVSRRGFLVGGAAAATALGGSLLTPAEAEAGQDIAPPATPPTLPVSLTVNGKKMSATVDARRTLLEMLRTDFDLTGTKQVCNHGSCGACTVLADGKPVYSCMTLAVEAEGKRVETIEGLAKGDKYHPLQTAFVERDALMCGFCTPGFLMAGKALLDAKKNPTLADVKDACAGNLCRCGTYPRIFEAVLDAAKKG